MLFFKRNEIKLIYCKKTQLFAYLPAFSGILTFKKNKVKNVYYSVLEKRQNQQKNIQSSQHFFSSIFFSHFLNFMF